MCNTFLINQIEDQRKTELQQIQNYTRDFGLNNILKLASFSESLIWLFLRRFLITHS